MPTTGRPVGRQGDRALQLLAVGVFSAVAEMGHDGQLVDQAEAHGQRAAPRIDHRDR